MVKYSGGVKLNDNLEIIYLKCPHCNEVSKADQWVTISLNTTSGTASFSFMGKPKDSNTLMCPKCKKDCNYLDIIEGMMRSDAQRN